MSFKIRPATLEDDYATEQIIKHAFGPGRFAKTIYRLREDTRHYHSLFKLVTENHLEQIVATIHVASYDLYPQIAILGPIAVEENMQNIGLGCALIKAAEAKCTQFPVNYIMLTGDPNYYARFGYQPIYELINQNLEIIPPSPMNKQRLLIKEI